MKTARQIFESLGYTLTSNNSDFIKYEKFKDNDLITFVFSVSDKKFYSDYNVIAHDITIDELKAVIQQYEELDWIDEKFAQISEMERVNLCAQIVGFVWMV